MHNLKFIKGLVYSSLCLLMPVYALGQCGVISSSPTVPLCQNEPVTFTVTTINAVTSWTTSTTFDFSSGIVTSYPASGNTIYFENGFTQNIFVKAHLASCVFPDPIFAVTVVSPVIGNIISSEITTLTCDTQYPVLITGNQNPESLVSSLYVWQISFDQSNWQNIPLANSSNYSINDQPGQSFYIRRIVNSLACNNSISNVLYFNVLNPPNGGTLTGGGNFCHSEQPVLELNGHSGSIATWEYSSNGTDFTPIAGTSNAELYAPNVIPGTHYFRVLIENPGCASQYSAQATVVKFAEISNEILTPDQSFCGAQIPENIQGNQPSGGGNAQLSVLWQKRTPPSTNWQNISNSNYVENALTFSQALQTTTYYRRITSSEYCSYTISDSVAVFITAEESDAGSFSSTQQTHCTGTDVQPIELIGFTGNIIEWYSSANATGPWSPLQHSDSILIPEGINDTTFFKVLVQNGSCESEFSDLYQFTVLSEIDNNLIDDNQLLCIGDSPAEISGSFPFGGNGVYNYLWEHKTNSTEWSVATGVSNELNFQPENIEQTHFYRRIVSSANCLSDTSNVIQIIANEIPDGYFSGGGLICPGQPLEITAILEGTPPFTIEYSDGVENYIETGINSLQHVISLVSDATTTYTLTGVSDLNCSTDYTFESSAITITPLSLTDTISAGNDIAVCDLSVQLSGTYLDSMYFSSYWTDSDGNVLSENANFTFESDFPGLYQLTYTVNINDCPISHSSSLTVSLDSPETAVAGENQQVCSNTTTLEANSIEVGIGHWQAPTSLSLSDPFDPNASLGSMQHGGSYELMWIAESIMGICPTDTSWVTITVDQLSDAGQLTSTNEEICVNDLVSLELINHIGEVTQWLFDDENGLQVVNSSITYLETEDISSHTAISVVVHSGTCPADTSNSILIEVSEATVAGTLIGDQEVCESANSGVLELTEFTGEIVSWEISTDNFLNSEMIYSNQAFYGFENLEATTWYRTKVQSGICPESVSNFVVVNVVPSVNFNFEIAEEFCSDDSPINLNDLVDSSENGEWTINGISQSTFDPSMYGNSEVSITYSNFSNGCGGSSTTNIYVAETPITWTTSDESICGLQAVVSGGASTGSMEWISQNELMIGEMTTNGETILTASDFGNYNITFIATNENCMASEDLEITFEEEPTESNPGEDQHLEYTTYTFLNATLPIVGIGEWSAIDNHITFSDVSDHKAKVSNLKPGENEFYWNVSNGSCPISSAKVIVHVSPFVVPNAFSPNGDNVNDFFTIRGIEAVSPIDIKIWNRWGDEVFISTNYQNEWDGSNKNGNELPSDTYYYLIKSPTMQEVLKGFIVLQR